MKKKLTIGIPTYNRVEKLKIAVSFLEKEGAFLRDEIQVIISDNASTDNTMFFLNQLKRKYPNIIVNHEDVNKGAEYNFSKIIMMSASEYTWLLGDDDVLLPGIIQDIMLILFKYSDISWVFIPFDCMIKEDVIQRYDMQYKEYYKCGLELFNLIAQSDYKFGGLMFISASIHRTSNIQAVVRQYKECNEFEHNQALTLGLAFYSAFSGSACVLKDTYIIDDIVDVSWGSKALKIFCRDQIAILDQMSKYLNINLLDYVDINKSLVYTKPEWTYLKSHSKENNYAMFFLLKHAPLKILVDLIGILKDKVLIK